MRFLLPSAIALGLPLALTVILLACSPKTDTASAASSSPESTDQDDPGEYGPSLGEAHVVRSLTLELTGGMNETIAGSKQDGHTTLSGECKPDMFANLSFDTGEMMGDKAGIGFATTDPITMGQTGAIDLDWVIVDVSKMNNGDPDSRRYKSDSGTLTLATHDPTKGRRRMTGTIVAKDLEPLDGLESKSIDVQAAFDADFSCGVK